MLSGIATSSQGGTKSPLVAREAAFRLRTMPILSHRKPIVHHPAVMSFRRPWSVAGVDWNHGAANAKFTSTQGVVMFGVVTLVSQNSSWTKVGRGLPHCWRKVGRVLTGPLSGNCSDDQLRRCVKDCSQLRPRCVSDRRVAPTTSLKVDRGMTRFQTGGVDRCGVAGVVDDQAASTSAVAAASEKLFEPPFSRSFCSTCHSVE